jgi:hypothetical protein
VVRALRKRYGRAKARVGVRHTGSHTAHDFGNVQVAVRYDKARDEYRGDLSWPEISDAGVVSPAIRHHKIMRIPAGQILVMFTDVRDPGARAKTERAAIEMVRTSGLPEFLWGHLR